MNKCNDLMQLMQYVHIPVSIFLFQQVRGWTRAAPLSCILTTQKDSKKLKQRESADPAFSNAEGPATSNTPDHLNQHAGSRCHAVGAGPLQGEASRWPVIRAVRRSPPQLLQGENPEELREASAAIRPARTQKPSHTSNTLVPIRHFTFLPPIPSPRPRPRALADGAKAPDVRSAEDTVGKNSRGSGTKVATLNPEPPAGAGQNHQNHPRLFSVISVAAQSRCLISGVSKRNTAHCRGLPSGKKVLHFGGANPSKTVCAGNL